MKKNVMMRVAAILLVCVLATTCGISGTFAKYVSSASTTDGARVAKWGWGQTAISLDLFNDTYKNGENVTVDSNDGANVIAPGTSQTDTLIWSPADSFAPEVDYELTFAVVGEIPEKIEDELKWTLKVDNEQNARTFETFGALQEAISAITYHGDAAAAGPQVQIQIGWIWEFENGGDAADTELGNAGTLASLEITVTMTATQKD